MDNNMQYNQDFNNAQYNQDFNNMRYMQGMTNYKGQMIPSEYRPISAWGYFGYSLLFSIPLVGFIMLLVFSLGGTQNVNLKNYSRSYFCSFLIVFVISLLFIGFAFLITMSEGGY